MRELERIITLFETHLWSFPMLLLLFGTHIYFTLHLHFVQRKIPRGIRLSFSKAQRKNQGTEMTSYGALATALAATIGTGNIIGISTAIMLGGPGAVFWCWLTGVLGIATCYAECFLSVKYRIKTAEGITVGGPMYVLEYGLRKKWLAVIFSLCAVLASFGIGSSVQSHSIQVAIERQITVSPHLVGIAAGLLAGMVIVGGNNKIAGVCTWLVPIMSVLYLGGCLWIIGKNRDILPETFLCIIESAFSAKAVAGGIVAGGMLTGMRVGISRGLFTNEAGLGSIPMTAAATKERSPEKQALISMTGPFWDTVVMCAITGIAAVGSIQANPQNYIAETPEGVCFAMFRELPFGGEWMLSVSLVLFAFATIIGWNVYGTTAIRYLWGEKAIGIYQVCYMMFVYLGAVISLDLVWGLSDLFNACMAVPNLLALWLLRKNVTTEKGHFL